MEGASEVRDALRALRDDDAATLDHVLALVVASVLHESPLVPGEVVDAISAQWAIEDDLANGGWIRSSGTSATSARGR